MGTRRRLRAALVLVVLLSVVAACNPSFQNSVGADHPVADWRLDEADPCASGATVHDLLGHSDGTFSPGVTCAVAGAGRGTGTAVTSTNGVFDAPATALPSGNVPRTLELWVKTAQYGSIIGYGNGNDDGSLGVVNDPNGILMYQSDHAGGESLGPGRLTDGLWHLLDITYDGTLFRGYLDGYLAGSATPTTYPLRTDTSGPFYVGGMPGASYDEVAVYDKALSASAIAAHWTAGASQAPAPCAGVPSSRYPARVMSDNPLVYYRLDDTIGYPTDRVAYDSVKGCRNAAYPTNAASAEGGLSGETDTGVNEAGFVASAVKLPSGNAPRTLELWVKTAQYGSIIGYGNGNDDGSLGVVNDPNGILMYQSDHAGGESLGPGRLTDGLWHLLDITYDGTLFRGYLDGYLAGSATPTTYPLRTDTSGPLSVGGMPGSSYDEVAVYGTALTPAQVAAHWTAGASAAGVAACASAPTSRYGMAVEAQHPLAYYRLDDTIGYPTDRVAFDSSGNCLNAAYPTNAATAAGGLSGETDTGVNEAGFDAPATSLPSGNAPRTLELWVKTSQYGPIIGYGNGNDDGSLGVVNDPNGILMYQSDHAGGESLGPGRLTDGLWHLLDITYDGTLFRGYIDGHLSGTARPTTFPLLTDTSSPLYVGGVAGSSYDEVAIYGTALTPREISSHWTAGATAAGIAPCASAPTSQYGVAVAAQHPVAYYRVDDPISYPTSRVAFDSSGNCLNGAYATSSASATRALAGEASSAAVNEDGFVTSAVQLPAANAPRTLELWLKTTQTGPIIQYGNGADNGSLLVDNDPNGLFVYLADFKGGVSLGPHIVDGLWHLLDVTYDGTDLRAYVDGQLTGKAKPTTSPLVTDTSGPLSVGGVPGSSYDEVAVYDTALTDDQVDAHWTAGNPRVASLCAGFSIGDIVDLGLDDPVAPNTPPATSGDRLAVDQSGHCRNAAVPYDATASTSGVVLSGSPVFMSDTALPAGNASRTIQMTVQANGVVVGAVLARYGDTSAANGDFEIAALDGAPGGTIDVISGSDEADFDLARDVSDHTIPICGLTLSVLDGVSHTIEVVYDGTASTVDVFIDGCDLGLGQTIPGPKDLPTATVVGPGLIIGEPFAASISVLHFSIS